MDVAALRRLHERADEPLGRLEEAAPEVHAAVLALGDDLDPERPVREQPRLVEHRLRGEVAAVAAAAELTVSDVEAVLDRAASLGAVDDAALAGLVANGSLDAARAGRFGLMVSLYRLFGGRLALATSVHPTVSSMRDLVDITSDGWLAILDDAGVEPPDGQSREAYARSLARTIATMFPSDALLARLAPRDKASYAARLAEQDREQLARTAVAYPGLGVEKIVANKRLGAAERGNRIAARADLLRQLSDANPDVELLELDLSPGSGEVAALTVPTAVAPDADAVLGALKTYQRVHRWGVEPDHAHAVLTAGYRAAADVVRDGPDVFARTVGLPEADARHVYDRAAAAFEQVAVSLATVVEAAQGGDTWSAVANQQSSIVDYLRRLDGYAELFGSQSSCRCDHCSSILSPAAYFVDLMSFVSERVTQVYFTGVKADDELTLINRRPDLWTTPLTCGNTNTPVPTLDIINEICENYTARRAGYTGDLTDRVAVRAVVYGQTLSAGADSFAQPFWLAAERLEEYLTHDGQSRATVANAVGAPAATRAAAAFRL